MECPYCGLGAKFSAAHFCVFFRSVDVEPSLHAGVAEAAELGARKLVFARLSSFEPHQNRPARDGILSKPQIRQVKTVNHVSRCEMNTHDLIDRNMQVIVELYVVVGAQFAVRLRDKTTSQLNCFAVT